jgi:hypothetical protein
MPHPNYDHEGEENPNPEKHVNSLQGQEPKITSLDDEGSKKLISHLVESIIIPKNNTKEIF